MKDLRQFCKDNNINCSTCSQSYKNWMTSECWYLYCGCGGQCVSEDYVCLDWSII